MSNVLQPLLYGIIKKYHDSRKDGHIFPEIATTNEIYHDVRIEIDKALASMVEDGIITCSENVNGIGMYAPINAKVAQSEE